MMKSLSALYRRILFYSFLILILFSLCLLFFPPLQEFFLFRKSRFVRDTNLWSEIGRDKKPELKKILLHLERGDIQPWIESAAPVIWWHRQEKFKAVDPQKTFESSELWYREVHPLFFFLNQREKLIGPAATVNKKSLLVEDTSPFLHFSRLFESAGIKRGRAGFELRYDILKIPSFTPPPPLLWRLSLSPIFRDLQTQNEAELIIPIEFWYFIQHNPIPIYFGTHHGDWESFLILFRVSSIDGNILANIKHVYTSAHGGGQWRCPEELEYSQNRLQLLSALDTHATYTTAGLQWRLYPDRTEKGEAWETWHNLKALVQEPYYGFSGSWGRTSFIHWMNGPISPGPNFKFLPASDDVKSREQWIRFQESCLQK